MLSLSNVAKIQGMLSSKAYAPSSGGRYLYHLYSQFSY